MPKCSLKVSAVSNRPLSGDVIRTIGCNLNYSVTDSLSVVGGRVENSVLIEFYDIEKPTLYDVWMQLYLFLKANSFVLEHHCAFLSWPGTEYYGCIWDFFDSICPGKLNKAGKLLPAGVQTFV